MQQQTAAEYALPYFRRIVWEGFKGQSPRLADDVIRREGIEGLSALSDYLAGMLAGFVEPTILLHSQNTRFRNEYPSDLIIAARENEFPLAQIMLYNHAGDLALFTATVIPRSLDRTLMTPRDYLDFASVAYGSVVEVQQRFNGEVFPVYVLLAEMTQEVAEMLTDVARHDLRMEPTLDRLEEIALEIEQENALSEVELIIKNAI